MILIYLDRQLDLAWWPLFNRYCWKLGLLCAARLLFELRPVDIVGQDAALYSYYLSSGRWMRGTVYGLEYCVVCEWPAEFNYAVREMINPRASWIPGELDNQALNFSTYNFRLRITFSRSRFPRDLRHTVDNNVTNVQKRGDYMFVKNLIPPAENPCVKNSSLEENFSVPCKNHSESFNIPETTPSKVPQSRYFIKIFFLFFSFYPII